jgi:hypothetical protein
MPDFVVPSGAKAGEKCSGAVRQIHVTLQVFSGRLSAGLANPLPYSVSLS